MNAPTVICKREPILRSTPSHTVSLVASNPGQNKPKSEEGSARKTGKGRRTRIFWCIR